MILLVPSDVLRPRRPDEHFAAEADAARACGIEVALIDHDALTTPVGADQAVRRVPADDDAVYRGWIAGLVFAPGIVDAPISVDSRG